MKDVANANAIRTTLAVVAALALVLAFGCGEKLTVPEAEGLYGIYTYTIERTEVDPRARQLLSVRGSLVALTPESLLKYSQDDAVTASAGGFSDATACCTDDADSLIFVWDQASHRVSWYSSRDLLARASADLPEVAAVAGMAASHAGIGQVPGASTFLYLADPEAGVVHRYAYHPDVGLLAHGILCRAAGQGARSVHVPGALARDRQDSLLVCDRDPERNWVIRFVSVPDLTDISADPDLDDPLRGNAGLYHAPNCNPPAASDYVIGDAPPCPPEEWVRLPHGANENLDDPSAVAVDGQGKIYIADRGNDRVQRFTAEGAFDLLIGGGGGSSDIPSPRSVAVLAGYPNGVAVPAYLVYVVCDDGVKRYRYRGTS